MRKLFSVLIVTQCVMLTGCFLHREDAHPGLYRMEQQVNFVPREGISRIEVEAYLGAPSHQSKTKEGHEYCMYELDASETLQLRDEETGNLFGDGFSIWRSVTYDRNGGVLDWYGFERTLAVVPTEPEINKEEAATDENS